MALNSEIRRAGPFLADGTTVTYSFSFKIFSVDEVTVNVSYDGGSTEEAIESDLYTVNLNENQDEQSGGTVTMKEPIAEGAFVSIVSNVKYLQNVVFTNRGGFYPEVLNQSLDRLTILAQQLKESTERAITVPSTSDKTPAQLASEILSVAAEANTFAEQAKKTYDEVVQTQEAITAINDNVNEKATQVENARTEVSANQASVSAMKAQVELSEKNAADSEAVANDAATTAVAAANAAGFSWRYCASVYDDDTAGLSLLMPNVNPKVGDHVVNQDGLVYDIVSLTDTTFTVGQMVTTIQGAPGTGLLVLDQFDTYEDMVAAHPTGSPGDVYLVGNIAWCWSVNKNAWAEVGELKGAEGPIGPTGPQGEPGTTQWGGLQNIPDRVTNAISSIDGLSADSLGALVLNLTSLGKGQGNGTQLSSMYPSDDANDVNITGVYTTLASTLNMPVSTSVLVHFERTFGAGTSAIQLTAGQQGAVYVRTATGSGTESSPRTWGSWIAQVSKVNGVDADSTGNVVVSDIAIDGDVNDLASVRGQIGDKIYRDLVDVDLNTVTKSGVYSCVADTYNGTQDTNLHFPKDGGMNGFLVVYRNKSNHVRQIWYRIGTVNSNDYCVFTRTIGSGGEAGNWYQVMTSYGGVFTGTVKAPSFQVTSDQRLKSDLHEIGSALSMIDAISSYSYQLKGDATGRRVGVIAQQVQGVLPEAVRKGDDGYLSVDYSAMTALALQAIKELKAEVEELKNGKWIS